MPTHPDEMDKRFAAAAQHGNEARRHLEAALRHLQDALGQVGAMEGPFIREIAARKSRIEITTGSRMAEINGILERWESWS